MEMKVEEFEASEAISNKLEQEHYNHARSYFKRFGSTEKNLKHAKDMFADYDKLKQKIIDAITSKGQPEDDYLKSVKSLDSKRAIYLIDVAYKDHKGQVNEPVRSNQWRKA